MATFHWSGGVLLPLALVDGRNLLHHLSRLFLVPVHQELIEARNS